MLRFGCAVLACVSLTASVPAQVLVLDEGTFSHSVNGTRVGREDFSVRMARGGAPGTVFVAQANVLAGENRRTLVLNADSTGAPVRFQLEAREATTVVRSVVGERERATWLSRVVAGPRESGREIRLAEATFVAEPGVVHLLWFVLRFGQDRPIVLLTPSASAQDTVLLRDLGADAVRVRDRPLAARRWELRGSRDGALRWELWADAAGRLLRARHPDSGLDALRDDPPNETLGR